jgi:chloramphenicol 3-O phosphotransferase
VRSLARNAPRVRELAFFADATHLESRDSGGALAADGFRFEATPDGVRVVVGGLGRQLLRAYQGAVRSAALVDINVIVDEVVIDQTSWDDWNGALADLDVVWVGVRCCAEVAEERNRVRGPRFAGLARAQADTVHRHGIYNFEIDTTTQAPDEAVRELSCRLGY